MSSADQVEVEFGETVYTVSLSPNGHRRERTWDIESVTPEPGADYWPVVQKAMELAERAIEESWFDAACEGYV